VLSNVLLTNVTNVHCPRGAVVRASGTKIWGSLCRVFESHCGTWVPVFRMRPYKPRSRVAVDLCGTIKIPPCSKALSAEHRPCHRQWWQPPDSWKMARVAINKQTIKTNMCTAFMYFGVFQAGDSCASEVGVYPWWRGRISDWKNRFTLMLRNHRHLIGNKQLFSYFIFFFTFLYSLK
jgi:hypothetical protein